MRDFFNQRKRIAELEDEILRLRQREVDAILERSNYKEIADSLQKEKDDNFVCVKLAIYEKVLGIEPKTIFVPRSW